MEATSQKRFVPVSLYSIARLGWVAATYRARKSPSRAVEDLSGLLRSPTAFDYLVESSFMGTVAYVGRGGLATGGSGGGLGREYLPS
ncbi:hypothetical protein M408DRAFT_171809 [Serendipita vermifera MAFF 305830]|uniref:Uncharacterized protein n=1 Tax=Serendipita vermifera MAFF 305830 TaxID=933852 RepID=A0A0C2WLU0_SERVB|nr:hypothetical protein M408DRAFT_171809 [Serendipita vermifera MAFF 305830]